MIVKERRESAPESSFDSKMRGFLHGLRGNAMSRRTMLSGAAATAAAATAAAALGKSAIAGPRPGVAGLTMLAQDATTVVFGLEGDVRGLEPALSYDFTANPVVCQITEGLLVFNPDGTLSPLLAESWEHPDALTYTYTLRDGVTFHNGAPVTADDVLASIARVRDPEVAGPMAWMYDDSGAVAEKVDEKTIKITLERPSALFQYVPATTAGHVVPAAAIEEFGLDFFANPVGTGPFKFVKWDQGSEIQLEKNADYWGEGPFFDNITFKVVEEGTTRVTGLSTGDLNMITAVPPDQIETVKGMENVKFSEIVGYTINCVAMRTDSPPFDDLNVRKAVALAIPWADIMANIVRDTGVQAHNTTVPANMPGSAADTLPEPTYDVEAAKALLAESASPDGFSTKYYVIAPNDIWVPQALAVQQALAELNIDVSIEQLPYADMITLQQAGDYEGMMSFQWGSDFPDAVGNLQPLFSSASFPPQNNHAYYSNPEVDQLLIDQDAEIDPVAREELLKQIQTIIAADQPMLFFEHYKWYMPMSTSLTGYEITPLWYWDCWSRTLAPAAV